MREPQIVESIADQLLRKVQESGEKRVNHLYLAPGELAELDPASVQQTGKTKQRYARGTDTIAHPSYHC